MRKTRTFVVTKKSLWIAEQARKLMAQYGLSGWMFVFDRAKRRAGFCRHPRIGCPGRISLSVHYCERNAECHILNTILHEIAHALVGPKHGHDEVWKAKCLEIGAKPERCYDSTIIDMPKGRWFAVCPQCRKQFTRHRKPRSTTTWHCYSCGRDKGTVVWTKI